MEWCDSRRLERRPQIEHEVPSIARTVERSCDADFRDHPEGVDPHAGAGAANEPPCATRELRPVETRPRHAGIREQKRFGRQPAVTHLACGRSRDRHAQLDVRDQKTASEERVEAVAVTILVASAERRRVVAADEVPVAGEHRHEPRVVCIRTVPCRVEHARGDRCRDAPA